MFYRANYKTYPGVGLWVVGTLSIASGRLALFMRGVGPVWPNILYVNMVFPMAGLARLGGVLSFTDNRRMGGYLLPAVVAETCIAWWRSPTNSPGTSWRS